MIIATFLDQRFKNKMLDSSNEDGSDLGTSTDIDVIMFDGGYLRLRSIEAKWKLEMTMMKIQVIQTMKICYKVAAILIKTVS